MNFLSKGWSLLQLAFSPSQVKDYNDLMCAMLVAIALTSVIVPLLCIGIFTLACRRNQRWVQEMSFVNRSDMAYTVAAFAATCCATGAVVAYILHAPTALLASVPWTPLVAASIALVKGVIALDRAARDSVPAYQRWCQRQYRGD